MSKILCQNLMSQIEDYKTNEEFNEHVYMTISQDLVKIYDAIEHEEYVSIYYIDSQIRVNDYNTEADAKACMKTFKLTNEIIFLSINTTDLFTCINSGVAINRNLLKKIKSNLENPLNSYIHSHYVDETQTINIHRIREL